MIVRILWTPDTQVTPPPSAETEQMFRTEGGWWFSETNVVSGKCLCYKVETRLSLDEGRALCEVVSPLPDTFIASPCWQDGPPQTWIRHQEGWELPSGLMVFQGQPSQLSLALQVPEHLRNEVQRKLPSTMFDVSQGPKGLTDPLLPGRQHQRPQGASPSRTKQRHESSSQTPGVLTPHDSSLPPQEPGRERPPQPESQVTASASPKAVQTGLLCSPKLLPDAPPPRKKGSRPQVRRGPLSQDHQCPPLCLIDPLLS